MPIITGRRYDHSKVYRPNGTRYAEGQPIQFTRPHGDPSKYEYMAISAAASSTVFAFREEFGEDPDWECVVVELVCDSTKAQATLFEVKER